MDQHTLPSDQMPYTVLPPTNFRVDGDEDELSDSEYTEAYLEYRIRRDMARLKRIREKEAIEQNHYKNDPNYTARRKKFSRIQDSVLEQLLKAMESCNARGFVYGIIPENGKPATGASDNLREWWKEKVRFDRNAPLAIENYAAQLMSPNSEQAREINIRDKLLKIHDTTLGSLLSSLMPHCDPPQRTFPLENGIPPPWWPTTNEEWWTELGFPTDKGTPPYKKPHDLKKLWKVGVVIGVLKHLCPHTNKARQLIKHSKSLQDRMTARDCILWSEVLDQLDRDYQKQHQNFPKLFDAGGSSHDCNVVTVDSQSNIRYEVDMSEESNMIYGRKRSAPFLAEDHNQRFFTNRAQFGPYMNFSGGNLVMTSEMNLNSNFNPSHYLTGANTQRIGYGQYGGSMNQSNDNIFGNIAHTEYNGYEENGGSVSQSNNNNFGNTAHTQFDGHGQYGGPMNQSNDNLNVQFAATQDNGFSGMRYSDEAMRMNGSDEWFGTGYC